MTITVYFETERPKYAEIAAQFSSEKLYHSCLPELEKLAKKQGFDIVTESIDHNKNIEP